MKVVKPHALFLLDFDQILEEGRRQERQLEANKGEYALVKSMHDFFSEEVMPLILSDDWVYKSATKFAEDYAADCFLLLRSTGNEIYQTQIKTEALKEEVLELIAKAFGEDCLSLGEDTELEKMSNFKSLIEYDRLSPQTRAMVNDLYARTVDHEQLHIWVALRSIRDLYEISLPRIMFVIRRAMKITSNKPPKISDDNLSSISDYISWYSSSVSEDHPLYPVLGELGSFYKVARNVASHHQGFTWLPEKNLIILEDQSDRIEVDLTTYLQKHRYLVHLCELGVRGILAAFCEREQGPIANKLVTEYAKTFPEDWDGGEKGKVEFYPTEDG